MTAALQDVVIDENLLEIAIETGPITPNKEVESSIHIWILDSTRHSDEDAEVIIEDQEAEEEKKEIGIDFPWVVIDTHAWKTLPGGKQIMIRTGSPGELSGNDMRKIDIAVKAAIADPDKMMDIRRTLVNSYVSDNDTRQGGILLDGASTWVTHTHYSAATNMAVANNVMKGRDRHAGLSPKQLEEIKRFEVNNDPYPKPGMLKAVNVMTTFNRGMAKEKFGDKPFTVYRGISGDQAIAIKAKAKRGDTIRINSNSLASFSTSRKTAQEFKNQLETSKTGAVVRRPGIVIKSKVSYRNVFDSYASNSVLSGRYKESEIIMAPRGMKMTGTIIDD